MRLRTAKVAIIPLWVLRHEQVRGNATRMAVYAGLQVVSFEAPETEWRSIRELAMAVSEVVGIGAEACRKHLAALEAVGALTRSGDDMDLPVDDPMGTDVGTTEPNPGSGGTQTAEHTSTPRKKESKTRSGYDELFERFWSSYPRKEGKLAASRAFRTAQKKGDIDAVRAGLKLWLPIWAQKDPQFIPQPATWLNGERYNDVATTNGGRSGQQERAPIASSDNQPGGILHGD